MTPNLCQVGQHGHFQYLLLPTRTNVRQEASVLTCLNKFSVVAIEVIPVRRLPALLIFSQPLVSAKLSSKENGLKQRQSVRKDKHH